MRLYVLIVAAVNLLNLVTAIGFDFSTDQAQASCKRDNCVNSCEAQGKSCCFCDQTKNFNLQACFCCPKDFFCCGTETWRGGSAHCCPNGYTCTKNGTCTVLNNVPASSAVGACGAKCRPDTVLYVTVDNSFRLFIDGEEQELENPTEWEVPDKVTVPGTAQVITICAQNELYKAGILVDSEIPDIIDNAVWRCINSIDRCPGKWTDKDFDDSQWGPGLPDEKNNGIDTRKEIVPNISHNTYWMWSNRSNTTLTSAWDKFCTCRIWLPSTTYGFQ